MVEMLTGAFIAADLLALASRCPTSKPARPVLVSPNAPRLLATAISSLRSQKLHSVIGRGSAGESCALLFVMPPCRLVKNMIEVVIYLE